MFPIVLFTRLRSWIRNRKSALTYLPKKISIRLSVLLIILPLLIGISTITLSTNYIALNSLLIATENNSISCSSEKVSEQISSYFKPLNTTTSTAFHMLNEGIVKLEYSDIFIKFLYSIIVNDANISGAFWGDIAGNFYSLYKVDSNYLEQITLRDGKNKKSIERIFNSQGKLLSAKKLPFDGRDPRVRPWYKQAKLKKQQIWITYKFLKVANQKESLGVTAAFPLYNSKGNLLGVFGVDMLVETISKYINDIKITKNSVIFLADDVDNLISVHDKNKNLLEDYELIKIPDLTKPWLKKSFTIYQQTHKSPFMYSFNNNKYISAYGKIADVKSEKPWFVAIVVPVDDIIAPLRKSILMALLFTVIAIVIGVILALLFSTRLSSPIKKLAQNANLICQLKFTEVKEIFSQIKEITEMNTSFMQMKNALGSFQLYMPATLVKKLVTNNKIAVIGGETKELTLLFTDIQNFTQLSENINPQELMQYLSRYFQVISKLIIEFDGTIDKYIGDAVMAFWGDPTDDIEHALHACQTALQIQKALHQFNEELRIENKPLIVTRIGINTGNVAVGNVGSDNRLNYTSLGDSVNLASRLEGLNKIYGTSIIISQFTYEKVKNKFKFRLLDKVAVKGKKQGVYIYDLLGDITVEPDLRLTQYNQEFIAAFSSYENGDWQTAIDLFNCLGEKYPEDPVIKIFIKRCSDFIVNTPQDWNGTWTMFEKK